MNGNKSTSPGGSKVLSREFKIKNKFGIHARPAALLVKTAGKFNSDITIEKGNTRVSGKSIMGLLTLEGHMGVVLRITAEGEDAEKALDAIEELIQNKFHED